MDNIKYDVFLSRKSEDAHLAKKLYDFLTEKGLKVFDSDYSLHELGDSNYFIKIHEVLENTTHLIVIGSSPENINSGWVLYEWDFFLNVKLTNRKTGNLLTVITDMSFFNDIHSILRYKQVIIYKKQNFSTIHNYVKINDSPAIPVIQKTNFFKRNNLWITILSIGLVFIISFIIYKRYYNGDFIPIGNDLSQKQILEFVLTKIDRKSIENLKKYHTTEDEMNQAFLSIINSTLYDGKLDKNLFLKRINNYFKFLEKYPNSPIKNCRDYCYRCINLADDVEEKRNLFDDEKNYIIATKRLNEFDLNGYESGLELEILSSKKHVDELTKKSESDIKVKPYKYQLAINTSLYASFCYQYNRYDEADSLFRISDLYFDELVDNVQKAYSKISNGEMAWYRYNKAIAQKDSLRANEFINKCFTYYQDGLKISQGDEKIKAFGLMKISKYYYIYKKDYVTAEKCIDDAIKINQKNHYIYNLAGSLYAKGQYLGFKKAKVDSLNAMKWYQNAIKYNNEALQIYSELKSEGELGSANCHIAIGVLKSYLNRPLHEAKQDFLTAISLYEKLGNKVLQSRAESDFAESLAKAKMNAESINYCNKAIETIDKSNLDSLKKKARKDTLIVRKKKLLAKFNQLSG